MKTKFQVLHERAITISKSYHRAESDLIAVLQEIDDCRGFREMGFKSLFDYATQALKLSESVSYNLIAIARKSKTVPKLQEMIRDHEMSVSNARMIAPILTVENQEKWLEAAASLSKRHLEKEIAKDHPQTQVTEQAKYVSSERLEFKMGLSEEVFEFFKRAQDLVSSQTRNSASFADAFKEIVLFYLKHNDPVEKAKRIHAKVQAQAQAQANTSVDLPVPGQVSERDSQNALKSKRAVKPSSQNQRFIPAQLQYAILLRDEGRCTQIGLKGERCSERRWLDIHHVLPLSQGGKTTLDNLKLLCRGHHRALHHAKNPLGSSTPFSFIRSKNVGTKPVHLKPEPSGVAVKMS
jgi:hypothetical protein